MEMTQENRIINERFLLAPWANSNELSKSLALYGVNTIGLRIVDGIDLAKAALERGGVQWEKKIISSEEKQELILDCLEELYREGGSYFGEPSTELAAELSRALDLLRMLLPEEEETGVKRLSRGEFSQKNGAIIAVYTKYAEKLGLEKTDEIGFMRFALEKAPRNLSVVLVKDFDLFPLEYALADALAGDTAEISLCGLYGVGDAEGSGQKPGLFKAYGTANEVERVVSDIYRNNKPLDECVVAVSDPKTFDELWYGISKEKGIPADLAGGISIANTSAAKLLTLLKEWNTVGFHGRDSLRSVVFSPYFDRDRFFEGITEDYRKQHETVKLAGSMRLSFDREENQKKIGNLREKLTVLKERYPELDRGDEHDPTPISRKLELLGYAEKAAERMERGYAGMLEGFLRKDSFGTQGMNKAAKEYICEALRAKKGMESEENRIDRILRKNIGCTGSKPGSLYVLPFVNVLSAMRRNVYVMGLTNDAFPGNPVENFLLLDDDLKLYEDGRIDALLPTSENLIRKKKRYFASFLHLADALGTKVVLSYSYYDASELKKENASSLIYDFCPPDTTYEEFLQSMDTAGYFSGSVSKTDGVGLQYIRDNRFKTNPVPEKTLPLSAHADLLAPAYSPTDLHDYFKCPRMFFYKKIMGITTPDTFDDAKSFEAYELGNVIHAMMEGFDKSTYNKEDFDKKTEAVLDAFLAEHVSLSRSDQETCGKILRGHVENAVSLDNGNKPVVSEKALNATIDVNGRSLKLSGRPDRVEEDENGMFRVIDYKTGSDFDYASNKAEGNIQVILYEKMLSADQPETYAGRIVPGEFHFTKPGKEKAQGYDASKLTYNQGSVKYTGDAAVEAALNDFCVSLETHSFEKKNACRYCDFKLICAGEED